MLKVSSKYPMANLRKQETTSCREIMGCSLKHCPAYNITDLPCWRVPNTLCKAHRESENSRKLELCLSCSVFKAYAEADPRGWGHFTSDELKYLMKGIHHPPFQRQENLLHILNNLPTGCFAVDTTGKIHYFNAAAERITGLSSSEAIGLRCRDVFRDPACEEEYCLDQIQLAGLKSGNRELRATTADGRIVPISCNFSVLMAHDGTAVGGVGVFKDISLRKHLEESLLESERKLSTLISNLPGMAYRCLNDQNWTMEFISDGCLELTGHISSDLIGNRVLSYNEVIHPDDRRFVWDDIQKALKEKQPFQLEYRIRTLVGKEKWVWEQGRGIFGDDRELLALEGFITEITDRKRLEEKLKASETKYRRIFEGSKDMIFMTLMDGAIKEVNQAGVDMLKYPNKQELLSLKSIENLYVNPIHWKVFQDQINRHGFVKDFEAGFKKRDGTRIHCLISGNAIRGKDQEIIGYEGIAKDFTARMEAARNLQQRHRELRLLHSVALAMNKTRNLDEILMTALKNILEALNLNSGAIFIIDHEIPAYEMRVQQGIPAYGINNADQIQFSDEPLMLSLLKKNIAFTPKPNFPPFKATLECAEDAGDIDLTCFLITAKEKASGFIALDVPEDRDLTQEQDFHLLGSLGNFLGGAIENARLLQTVDKHREELRRLTARLFHSQEEERKRIAQELHDETGQALTAINFTLEVIEKKLQSEEDQLNHLVAETKKQINRTYEEMRRISYRLHPSLLSDLGLEPALDSYLTSISKHRDLEIDFKMVGFEERLEPDMETVLYRLCQEALTNVLKHSLAKQFKLYIIRSYPRIIFIAEDNGVGFDSSHFEKNKQALGLLGMRERAAMLGGTFSLHTQVGEGTRIRIEIPISRSSHG